MWTHPDYTSTVTVTHNKITATFLVEVKAATEDRQHSFSQGWVTAVVPALRVTTLSGYDTNAHPIVIRKRPYAADMVYDFGGDGWRGSRHYHYRGPLDDALASVDYRTATYDVLTELAELARDAYVGEHMDWVAASHTRYLDEAIAAEIDKAADLRRKADAHDLLADELRTKRAAF